MDDRERVAVPCSAHRRVRRQRRAAATAEPGRDRPGSHELAGGGGRTPHRRARTAQEPHGRRRECVALRRSARRRMEVERHVHAAQRDRSAVDPNEQRERRRRVQHAAAVARLHAHGDRQVAHLHARLEGRHRRDVLHARLRGDDVGRELLQRHSDDEHGERRSDLRAAAHERLDLQARADALRQRADASRPGATPSPCS